MRTPFTYHDFLRQVSQLENNGQITAAEQIAFFWEKYRSSLSVLPQAFYIIDYAERKYSYLSNGMRAMTDYDNQYLKDGGLQFALSLWHPEDLRVYSEKVFPENLHFLKSNPGEVRADHTFSCNYRVRDRKGNYKTVLQQSTFLYTKAGVPLINLGFLSDISDYVSDNRIVHSIRKMQQDDPLIRNIFYADEANSLLTKREIEILKYVCNGCSSEEISRRINRSINTVSNHRRNILRKTNCINTAGLIQYALKNQLL
jgi:DNA-binding CsgD family transcriptional regulator